MNSAYLSTSIFWLIWNIIGQERLHLRLLETDSASDQQEDINCVTFFHNFASDRIAWNLVNLEKKIKNSLLWAKMWLQITGKLLKTAQKHLETVQYVPI